MLKFITTLFIAALFLTNAALAQENIVIDSLSVDDTYIFTYELDENDKHLVRVEGDVGFMFGFNLVSFITKHQEDIAYIEFHSSGGYLPEIDPPTVTIRELEIPVIIRKGDVCVSACAFLVLASPDITINGQIAFHLPYTSEFTRDMTLYSVSQSTVATTIHMTRHLFNNKWAMMLYHVIAKETDNTKFVVFENTEYLNAFRIENKDDFTKNHIQKTAYQVRDFRTMIAYAVQQISNE